MFFTADHIPFESFNICEVRSVYSLAFSHVLRYCCLNLALTLVPPYFTSYKWVLQDKQDLRTSEYKGTEDATAYGYGSVNSKQFQTPTDGFTDARRAAESYG